MEKEVIVSVIVPCYNMADTVQETVDSILESTLKEIEIIIVDDGSKDESYSIIKELAKKEPRIRIYQQENQGVCAARNLALDKACGRYIFPLDADDIVMPRFLERASKVLDENSSVKVVTGKTEFFEQRSGEWKLPDFSRSLLARKNILPANSVFRREEALKIGGYCKEIIAREDWEFWIHMLKDGGEVVKLDSETEILYRVRKGSKRYADRKLKKHVIRILNERHAEFFKRELKGPLRYRRSWSKTINRAVNLLKIFH